MTLELLLIAAQYLDSQQNAASDAWLRCDHGYALSTSAAMLPQQRRRRRSSKSQNSLHRRTPHRTVRSMHNEMEKTRRANLRHCLDQLRYVMPDAAADKTTTLQLLKRAKLHVTRLEADFRSHEQMRASLMDQQRQLNDYLLLLRRHQHHHHHQQQQRRRRSDDDDDADAQFAGVVVVKETRGTCSGHVTDITQLLDDIGEDTASSRASPVAMSTSSDSDDIDIMGSASDCSD